MKIPALGDGSFTVVAVIASLFVLYAGAMALSALVIRWTWNVIAPLWHGPLIGFLQALAIAVLLSVIGQLVHGSHRAERA